MDKNLEFIKRGKLGCVFATYFAKNPNLIGWKRIVNPEILEIPSDAFILSLIFEGKTSSEVLEWCWQNGFYYEYVDDNLVGLRYKFPNGQVAWVQYFGPDSHVKTRQTPIAEIAFCVKIPSTAYFKTLKGNILHLANASVAGLSEVVCEDFWRKSFIRTKQILGHNPTIEQAAKTTFKLW